VGHLSRDACISYEKSSGFRIGQRKKDMFTLIVLVSVVITCVAGISRSGSSSSSSQLLLPVDNTIFSDFSDSRLELEVARPIKGDLVLTPQTKFETWAVFAYNSVVQADETNGLIEHRMYYDCIAGTGVPPGRRRRLDISHRYVCLATSADGLIWVRPTLNIFSINGSKANNVLLEDSGVSVFHDPSAKDDSERWKMICSNSAYASSDGLHWTKLPFAPVATDDTKPTAYYDPSTKKYAIVLRRDLGDVVRYIGRCDTTNLSNWQESSPAGCPNIFGVDDEGTPIHSFHSYLTHNSPTHNSHTYQILTMSIYTRMHGHHIHPLQTQLLISIFLHTTLIFNQTYRLDSEMTDF